MKTMTLTDWLLSLPNMKSAQSGQLVFKGKTYESARYEQELSGPSNSQNPGKYIAERIYCLADSTRRLTGDTREWQYSIPKELLNGKAALVLSNDAREWYMCGHIGHDAITPQFAHAHPFGANFILAPWDVPGGEKIDKYDGKPYTRFPTEFVPY